jgi:DNA anti-recombination protein RmuC
MSDGGNGEAVTQSTAGETKTPEEIRAEIEQTREQLGDTVEALAEKTDVKTQARNRIQAVKEAAAEAMPESVDAGVEQISSTVRERPLPFATGGAFAAGVIVGWRLGRR